MPRGPLVAYVTSCIERREVRDATVADLAATDWGAPPVVVLDQRRVPDDPHTRLLETGRSLLVRATSGPGDLFVSFEDDLEFNRSIRFNLEHWPPLAQHRPGDFFFGSLYNPNIAPVATDDDPATYCSIDPVSFYGSQAIVISATTACWILDHWDEQIGFPDIRMSRLAAARSPIYFHRPSLVQHRAVPSRWGGVAHSAIDFLPDWRAPER